VFNNGFYAQAVFYLEQSIEKAVKSVGLHYNIITEKDLRDISHEATKIYAKIFRELKKKVAKFYDKIRQLPALRKTTLFKKYSWVDRKKFEEMLNRCESYISQPQRGISEQELEKLLSELSLIYTEVQKCKVTQPELEEYKAFVRKVAESVVRELPRTHRTIRALESLDMESLSSSIASIGIPQAICNTCLMLLAPVLIPHATSTRYPYPEYEQNPLTTYTPNNPIVRKFHQLAGLTEIALNAVTSLYSQPPLENK